MPDSIDWYPGTLEEAFATATAEGKPVFLYWSAEWCPPCHHLKVTLFRDRSFIDRSRLFVPVYLDGDTEAAQKHGETFGVAGYPTMVVLDPAGEEIMRIAGGIDVAAYAGILDATLSGGSPVPELVAAAKAGTTFNERDCRLVAYYPWEDDQLALLEGEDPGELFARLENACPEEATAERSRLSMSSTLESAMLLSRGDRGTGSVPPIDPVMAILVDHDLVKANIASVLTTAGLVVGALTDPESESRARLSQAWLRALERVEQDGTLPKRERIYTALGRIDIARLDREDAPLPGELVASLEQKAAWADDTTPDPNERQTVMNAVANTFWQAKLYDRAREVLKKELSISKQPYYYTLSLAELEQDAGNDAQALVWFERAYDEARGEATRFQWGYNYVVGLIDIVPDDAERIERETLRVFGELRRNAANAFYQRTFLRIERLEERFLQWNEAGDRTDSLRAIRAGVMEICRTIGENEESRGNCESFLDQV